MGNSVKDVYSIPIDGLAKSINEQLVTMVRAKYTVKTFIETLLPIFSDAYQNKELQPNFSSVFIDKRLYSGESAIEDYRQDAATLLECCEQMKMYFEVLCSESDSRPMVEAMYDGRNTVIISESEIIVAVSGE